MASEPKGEAELTLYVREYCHLCHDMRAALDQLRARYAFSVTEFDVDEVPELEARFGERVPVLLGGGRELCHYVLDAAAVGAYLAQIR